MALEGLAASPACLEAFGSGLDVGEVGGCWKLAADSLASLLTASDLRIGRGGGKGEMDMAETLAEWAW